METVCVAYALASWHMSIKVERSALQRGNKITELEDAVAARGSQLTDEMAKVLDEASKVVPDEADEEEQNASAPKKKRARHS